MNKRFKYHFEPKKGWMNDPNGLVYFKGKHHLFFQHNPYDVKWGPMHWGHAVSEDLIHFEEQPIALCPDMAYEDDGGCFSGSAIVKEGRLFLFYTSVSRQYGQTQSVAFSDDGIHFTKYENNPVIYTNMEDGSQDFRDPKVFAYRNEYRMVLGSRHEGRGRVLQYRSENLLDWEYVGVLYETPDYHEPVECPDLFYLDGKWVLMFSRIGFETKSTLFLTGEFDGMKFTPGHAYEPEIGPQFYAPQTYEDNQGRRILVGWFYDWKRAVNPGSESAGAFTAARELSVRDGMLYCAPVKEAAPLLWEIANAGAQSSFLEGKILIGIKNKNVLIYMRKAAEENSEGILQLMYETSFSERVQVLEDEKALEIFVDDGIRNYSLWG